MIKFLLTFCLISLSLLARPIETFYGIIEVDEPVILELVDSPAFQRLKEVHQYGVSYYTTHKEEFTRYSHSLGVFHLLRASNRPLNEQIAGLLHDVSHTAFSHVGDWVFDKEYKEIDYQNSIHEVFLEETGLAKILKKYNIDPKDILPEEKTAPALEKSRPNASADRLDYSIQGGYHQNFLTKAEALEVFEDCKYIENRWVSTKPELMSKVIAFTLFMTEDCFSSPENHLSSRWLADAIIKALETSLISRDEFHFGTDNVIWDKLISSNDPYIQSRMEMVFNAKNLFRIVDPKEADIILNTKFWGFDPWIAIDGKVVRLTSINRDLKADYQAVKDRIALGFSIKLIAHEKASAKSA